MFLTRASRRSRSSALPTSDDSYAAMWIVSLITLHARLGPGGALRRRSTALTLHMHYRLPARSAWAPHSARGLFSEGAEIAPCWRDTWRDSQEDHILPINRAKAARLMAR
jgi:hypothetical protein